MAMRAAQRILRVLPEVWHSTQRLTRSSMVRAVSEVVQRKIRGAMSEKEMSDTPKRTTQPPGPTPVDEFFDELRKLTGEDMSSKESWTTEFPTKAGTYWIRNFSEQAIKLTMTRTEPELVRVYEDGTIYWIERHESYSEPGYISAAEWYGPIDPPSE
jgi:hypothetical protein